jgi:hypothetical protein
MITDTKSATETLNELTGYRLANEAGCASPDSVVSAGAKFLNSVRDAVVECVETIEEGEIEEWDDQINEIADNAPDVYTSTMWAEFVDLGAYQEDPTDLGVDGSDMDQSARICLYIIAERLARALFAMVQDNA